MLLPLRCSSPRSPRAWRAADPQFHTPFATFNFIFDRSVKVSFFRAINFVQSTLGCPDDTERRLVYCREIPPLNVVERKAGFADIFPAIFKPDAEFSHHVCQTFCEILSWLGPMVLRKDASLLKRDGHGRSIFRRLARCCPSCAHPFQEPQTPHVLYRAILLASPF